MTFASRLAAAALAAMTCLDGTSFRSASRRQYQQPVPQQQLQPAPQPQYQQGRAAGAALLPIGTGRTSWSAPGIGSSGIVSRGLASVDRARGQPMGPAERLHPGRRKAPAPSWPGCGYGEARSITKNAVPCTELRSDRAHARFESSVHASA